MNFVNTIKNLIDGIDDLPVKSLAGKMALVIVCFFIAFGILMFGWWINQWLWNDCLASYFGWEPIGYWQMAGICILFNSLFKTTNNSKE